MQGGTFPRARKCPHVAGHGQVGERDPAHAGFCLLRVLPDDLPDPVDAVPKRISRA